MTVSPHPDSPLGAHLARHARDGELLWIGCSPGRREPIVEVASARVCVGTGLDGDRHARSGRGRRQVTLIQAEHLAAIGAFVGREVHARELRRNLLVSGINLLALRRARFRVGEVLLEGSGACHPCSRMEEALGPGGLNACRGHGGITAIVVEPGVVHVGDAVRYEGEAPGEVRSA